jgi:amidase
MNGPDLQDPYTVPAPLDRPGNVDLEPLCVATYLDDGIADRRRGHGRRSCGAGDERRRVQHTRLRRPDHGTVVGVALLRGDRGVGFEQDLQAISATDPSEELAEFLRQAREVDFPLSEARRRFVAIDEHRIEVLTVTADYDVILCPAMPTPAKPHHHGLVEINDFSHVMVHNLTGWPAAVGVQIVARPWQDSTALAVAGFLVKVFGGWRRPPPVAA